MTADSVGGVWTYALELVNALAERDVEVVLATMGAPLSPGQRRELRGSRAERVYAQNLKLEWMDDPWSDLEQAGRWLLAIRDELQPDVVHLNGYFHAVLPWEAPTLVVGHSCVLSWFAAVRGQEAPPTWTRYAERVRSGLQAADLVVSPTRTMLRELERWYELRTERETIPNGLRPPPLRSAGEDKEPLVLTAGRLWDEAKNVAALDRVAEHIAWPVVVAGALDPGQRTLHAEALGHLDRRTMDAWLSRASIFALPARYEPFGLAALEAGRAGAAVVLGDIPSLREVWEDAALYVDPDDDDALAAALTLLIDERELREEMAGRAGRCAATYTSGRMASSYIGAYERLASAGASKPTPLGAIAL
ncbi:MAG: glycosyltransferase family 4 protein [Actinomycetota bacterium]|nr:glycosyltransferase family 4 protein [Actinomycetota bacterium]